MAPAPNVACGMVSMGKDRGCGVDRDGVDRTLRPGRAVPAESAAGLTPLALAATDKEWVAAGDAAMMGPEVLGHALARAAGRVVVFRIEVSDRKARAGGADTQ